MYPGLPRCFAELKLLGEMSYANEESIKRRILQNCVSSDSKDVMILREICANKSHKDSCKMIFVHAITVDEKEPRGVHFTLGDHQA